MSVRIKVFIAINVLVWLKWKWCLEAQALKVSGFALNLNFKGQNMQDDDTEQPLTDHLVDQFASYFLLTMLTFHLFGYVKKQYEKRMAKEKFPLV